MHAVGNEMSNKEIWTKRHNALHDIYASLRNNVSVWNISQGLLVIFSCVFFSSEQNGLEN